MEDSNLKLVLPKHACYRVTPHPRRSALLPGWRCRVALADYRSDFAPSAGWVENEERESNVLKGRLSPPNGFSDRERKETHDYESGRMGALSGLFYPTSNPVWLKSIRCTPFSYSSVSS